jgi:hypothetical protein
VGSAAVEEWLAWGEEKGGVWVDPVGFGPGFFSFSLLFIFSHLFIYLGV